MANLKKQRQQPSRLKIPPQHSPKFVLYGRVSSDKQSKEATIERQQSLTNDLVKSYFKDKASMKVGEYWDEGYNLEKKNKSTHFWKLMDRVQRGEVNTIIVSSEDRIFRGESAKLRGEITDILRHNGVRLITSNSDTQYSRSATSDRLVTSIKQELGSINKLEAVRTLQHGRRRKLKEEAKWCLNICPYGLRVDRQIENHQKQYTYRIVEEEARYVRDIFRLYCGEKPEHLQVAFHLNAQIGSERISQILNKNKVSREQWIAEASQGIGTKAWDKQKVLRILLNETYAGRLTVVFAESEKVAGFQDLRTEQTLNIPAIVDERLFKKAQTIYHSRRAKLVDDMQPRTDINFLHGLLKCPKCGASMRGRVANAHHRYYGCPNTSHKDPHPLLRAEDYEAPVEKYLIQVLSGLDFYRLKKEIQASMASDREFQALQAAEKALLAEQSQLKARKLKILDGWESGLIDDELYRARIEQLKKREVEISQDLRAGLVAKDELTKPEDRLRSLENLRSVFQEIMANPDAQAERQAILKMAAGDLIESIALKELQKVEITTKTPKDRIKRLLSEGRVISKDVRDALGYTPKKMLAEFGRHPRKARINYAPEIRLKR